MAFCVFCCLNARKLGREQNPVYFALGNAGYCDVSLLSVEHFVSDRFSGRFKGKVNRSIVVKG